MTGRAATRVAACLLTLAGSPARALPAVPRKPAPPRPAARPAVPPAPRSFVLDVLPILTRAGCNSGACHGAATGRGGFRLSLLAGDPAADYRRVAQEFGGRRLDPARPRASLLLRKASGELPHGGGKRLPREDAAYLAVERWIAAGAPEGHPEDAVLDLRLEPGERLAAAAGGKIDLCAVAVLFYGDLRSPRVADVTSVTVFSSNDPGTVSISESGGAVVHRPGTGVVLGRFLSKMAVSRLGLPYVPGLKPRPRPAAAHPVDRVLQAEWDRMGLRPSPPATDSVLLRRLTLDLAGRLPTPEEVQAFEATAPEGRIESLTDRLLRDPTFVDAWTWRLGEWLQLDSRRHGEPGAKAYHAWLRRQVSENRPLDGLIGELATATGPVDREGPAAFARTFQDPRDQSEFVGRALLGYRLGCARCHNHPVDRWSQQQYYAFAATFARIRLQDNAVVDAADGEIPSPWDGEPVPPAPPGGSYSGAGENRRAQFAGWLRGPARPLVAAALANRLWQAMMGRGVIEPVDDVRHTNPPSVPRLLDVLTDELIRQGFDLRGFLRWLSRSQAYRLSSTPLGANASDDRLFSRSLLKPLAGPVLADAIADATGVPFEYAGLPVGTRAVQHLDARVPSYTLDVLGRCRRDAPCDPATTTGGGLAGALHLLNGPPLNERVGKGRVARLISEHADPATAVTALYRASLSRGPTRDELEHWTSELRAGGDAPVLEDLMWGLLNCREFLWNH